MRRGHRGQLFSVTLINFNDYGLDDTCFIDSWGTGHGRLQLPCGFSQVARGEVETSPRKVDDFINFTFRNDERRRQNHRVANRAHDESVRKTVIPALSPDIDSPIEEDAIRFVVHQLDCA